MKNIYFGFSVDDVCYEGYSSEPHLERIFDFCGKEGLHATFFAVPVSGGRRLKEKPGYVNLLKNAVSLGHEVAQHGIEHKRFEVGITPDMVLSLPHEGPAREYLRNHRKEIEGSLQTGNIRRTLSAGRNIIEEALGERVKGFRAPCLQSCDNMFRALAEEKYLYDSSRYLQTAGWDLANGINPPVPEPITRKKFESQQYPGSLKVLPLTTEYTWYLGKDRFRTALELAKHDFDACAESGIPFIPVCHVSPLQEGETEDLGFELYRELLGYARQKAEEIKAELKMLTLSGICELFFTDNC